MPTEGRGLASLLPHRWTNRLFPWFASTAKLVCLAWFSLTLPARSRRRAGGQRCGTVASANAGRVPKTPTAHLFLTPLGVLFDAPKSALIADWGGHGGADKAVCVFDAAAIDALAAEGHPIAPGAVGDQARTALAQRRRRLRALPSLSQLTLRGVPWSLLRPGARFAVGPDAVLAVTEPAYPCATIRGAFTSGQKVELVDERKHPGRSRWYCSVQRCGWVAPGDEVRLLSRAAAPAAAPVPAQQAEAAKDE